MLSIIVCTIDADQLKQLHCSIEKTIGIPFEIVAIENRTNPRGITAVYNEGVRRAQFPYLCFVHEDVLFETENWGKVAIKLLQDPAIGLVGIAGSGYKSLSPSGWDCLQLDNPNKSFQYIIQGYKYQQKPDLLVNQNPFGEKFSEVVAIDGVWFCTRKELALKYPFDEQFLTGFHGYDIDFSLNIKKEYKVVVTFEILLKHLSEGNFDKKWLVEILKLHKKWNAHLPLYIPAIKDEEVFLTEKNAFKAMIDLMLEYGFPSQAILQMLLSSYASPKMSLKLFSKIYFYYLKKTWKRR